MHISAECSIAVITAFFFLIFLTCSRYTDISSTDASRLIGDSLVWSLSTFEKISG